MPGPYNIDFDPNQVSECFALVYTPRKLRNRFPENCVTPVESLEAALAGADAEKHLHPAVVVGPARSSEGFRLYYLARWLA